MSVSEGSSRRGMLIKLGVIFNAAAGVVLGVPIVRYLLGPLMGQPGAPAESWLSLGSLDQFPAGQTRIANYKNPVTYPADGQTANIPCWVRHTEGEKFQGFAINC